MLLANTFLPYAGKIKNWDKNKDKKFYYQDDPEKEKPGQKRNLELKEEFIILILLRLTRSYGKASCLHVRSFCQHS